VTVPQDLQQDEAAGCVLDLQAEVVDELATSGPGSFEGTALID
jgi:hypothetical protein